MIAVGWGDVGFGFGVDGKLYKAPKLDYASMTVVYTPTSPWVGFGRTYRVPAIAIDEQGRVSAFDSGAMTFYVTNHVLAAGVKAIGIGWPPDGSLLYVLGDNGVIYRADNVTTPTTFTSLSNTKLFKKFAVSASSTRKTYGIDANGALWEYSVTGGTGTNDVASSIGSYSQLLTGTKFKAVHTCYGGAAAALTTDNKVKILVDGGRFDAALETSLPAGFTVKEIAFGYGNLLALSTDGRVCAAGAGTSPTGPYKAPGTNPTSSAWAEYDLPRPCPGFGTAQYSGSGYDFALILP